jgi:hypothetical protein
MVTGDVPVNADRNYGGVEEQRNYLKKGNYDFFLTEEVVDGTSASLRSASVASTPTPQDRTTMASRDGSNDGPATSLGSPLAAALAGGPRRVGTPAGEGAAGRKTASSCGRRTAMFLDDDFAGFDDGDWREVVDANGATCWVAPPGDPRDVPEYGGDHRYGLPVYFVDDDGNEFLVEGEMQRCTATTKLGKRCANFIFAGCAWTEPTDDMERDPVTFDTASARQRALTMCCSKHVPAVPKVDA